MKAVQPLEKSVRRVQSWKDWKNAWDSTERLEFLHSLLHFGFEAHLEDEEFTERVLFYLQVAEGWTMFTDSGSHQLARKAFEMLCLNYFKQVQSKNITLDRKPAELERDLRIHQALLIFFRPQAELDVCGRLPLVNVGLLTGHHAEIVKSFLPELIRLCWYNRNQRMQRYRPRYVEILASLGELELLTRRKAPNLDLEIDNQAMAKLEELALKPRPRLEGEPIIPNDVEHAAFLGSAEAQTLLILRVMRQGLRNFR